MRFKQCSVPINMSSVVKNELVLFLKNYQYEQQIDLQSDELVIDI